jgi:hypothetical protein
MKDPGSYDHVETRLLFCAYPFVLFVNLKRMPTVAGVSVGPVSRS